MKKKSLAILLICVFVLTTSVALAASIKCEVTTGKISEDSNSIVVTVRYSSDDLARVDANLEYDVSELEYMGGGNSIGNGGVVIIKDVSDDGQNIYSELEFKPVKTGQATITLTTNEAYDFNENYIDVEGSNQTITINTETEAKPDTDTDTVPEIDVEPGTNPDEIITDDVKVEDVEKNGKKVVYVFGGIIAFATLILSGLIIAKKRNK